MTPLDHSELNAPRSWRCLDAVVDDACGDTQLSDIQHFPTPSSFSLALPAAVTPADGVRPLDVRASHV